MAQHVTNSTILEEPDKETKKQQIDLSYIKDNWMLYLSKPGSPIPIWPREVILYKHTKNNQVVLPDYANCLSTIIYLKMCNIKYEIEEKENAEFMSPSLTVPFIKIDNNIVAELDGIINCLNNRNIKLSDKLDKEQKINLKAFMSLVPNILEMCELYVLWADNYTYENLTKPKYSSIFPWPINWMQSSSKRKQILKKLDAYYWLEKPLQEVLQQFETFCEAICDRLNGKLQFFENCDTELDASIFGHLYTILHKPLPGNPLKNILKKFPSLILFVESMNARFLDCLIK